MSQDTWVERAFNREYLSIYDYRDEDEARQHIQTLVKLLELKPSCKIFDCCCGSGRYSQILKQLGYDVTGMDFSEDLINEARKIYSEIKFVRGDMRVLPFKQSFDQVLSLFTSFGYFESDATNISVLEQMKASLKNGGKLYLDYLNPLNVEAQDWLETIKNNGVLKTKKEIDSDTQMVIKTVRWKSNQGDMVEYKECVKLYCPEWFKEKGEAMGLKLLNSWGDYHVSELTENSPRNIYLFQKK